MKIFATPEFKHEYENLIRNKSYRYISEKIIQQYIECEINDALSGTKLNGSSPNPFIKKRIGGSGGSRLYYVVVPEDDCIYLGFIHPKSPPGGYENVSNQKKADILDEIYNCKQSNNLYTVISCSAKKNLIFESAEETQKLVATVII